MGRRVAELEAALARERLLGAVARDVAAAGDLQETFRRALNGLAEVVPVGFARIALPDGAGQLETCAQFGVPRPGSSHGDVPTGDSSGPGGAAPSSAAEAGGPTVRRRKTADRRAGGADRRRGGLVVPLGEGGLGGGVLELETSGPDGVGAESERLIERLAGLLGEAIRRDQLERAREDFLSFATHELKTPITSIRGYAQILLRHCEQARRPDGELNWDRLLDSLATINLQTDRLRRLVDELLEVSRLKTGRVTLDRTRFDLFHALDRWLVALRRGLPDRAIRLVRRRGAGALVVEADLTRVEQTFASLVKNAAQYSEPDSPIVISAGRRSAGERPFAEVSVRDEGIGIPPEEVAHVFERFRPVAGPAKRRREGMGVSLYVASEMLKLQGGEIECRSAVGKGSTFTFRLPLVAEI